MSCGLEGNKGEGKVGEACKKHRTYSGTKCSIVEYWFPEIVNCFVKCISTQRIKHS
jgi:hypothetical protein